ncbi:MAG TPA: c-type cytochrome [Cyclobacteriaceae bacterium]
MKILNFLVFIIFSLLIISCGGPKQSGQSEETSATETTDELPKGTIKYVTIDDPLDEEMVSQGKEIYENQCTTCHHLTEEEMVGPGWAGITNRRHPDWIMNMIINVNLMVEVDSLAHSLLQKAKVKMPDQRLSVDQARSVLEFMRQNDLDQLGTKDEGAEKS